MSGRCDGSVAGHRQVLARIRTGNLNRAKWTIGAKRAVNDTSRNVLTLPKSGDMLTNPDVLIKGWVAAPCDPYARSGPD